MKARVIGAIAAVLLAGWMAGTARADFWLYGNEQMTINTPFPGGTGHLYDQSRASVVSGGLVGSFMAYDTSGVQVSGGSVAGHIRAYHTSEVHISDGSVFAPFAYNSTTVGISGGSVANLYAYDTSEVQISGGSVGNFSAGGNSIATISGGSVYGSVSGSGTVTFDGQDFVLGTGLSLDGVRVLGTGRLSGKWLDGTAWTVDIGEDASETAILLVPATLRLDGRLISPPYSTSARPFLVVGNTLSGRGTIHGEFGVGAGTAIVADEGDMALGDPTSYAGFTTEGRLDTRANTITLHAKGFAGLGILTELGGGILAAPNGIVIGPGRALAGSGTVEAKVSAAFGSTIEATGPLSLGDSDAYDGFYSDGQLLTGGNVVTINDRNVAVLGSLTQLGEGAAGGTVTAGNAVPADTHAHFLLEQGKNMIGRGAVNGNFKNHGDVIGDGVALAERIVFNAPWIVSGKGVFANTLVLGTFAPGDSPTISPTTNQAFGSTSIVQIELGGTEPGSGNDNHDQIADSNMIFLFDSPTLEVLPWNGFVPEVGDEFVILTWQDGLAGEFGSVATDPWFTDRGISFDLTYTNVGGAGNLTIEAVPEPATLSLLALGGLAAVRRRPERIRRRSRRCSR